MNYRTWHKLSHGHCFAVTIENLQKHWINWNKCSRKSNIPHVSTSKMIWNECYTIATYPSWAFHVWFYGFCERTYNDEWEWSQEKWTGLSPYLAIDVSYISEDIVISLQFHWSLEMLHLYRFEINLKPLTPISMVSCQKGPTRQIGRIPSICGWCNWIWFHSLRCIALCSIWDHWTMFLIFDFCIIIPQENIPLQTFNGSSGDKSMPRTGYLKFISIKISCKHYTCSGENEFIYTYIVSNACSAHSKIPSRCRIQDMAYECWRNASVLSVSCGTVLRRRLYDIVEDKSV